MNNFNELPIDDLISTGIMNEDKTFSSALSKKQIDNFIKGGTMLVETDTKKYILNLSKDVENDRILNKAVIAKDYKMSFELDNDENRACLEKDVINKDIQGYGTIKEIGKKPYLHDQNLKEKTYVSLVDEKGEIQEFWGDKDLESKLEKYKKNDLVQIDFKGINVKNYKNEEQGQSYQENENIFDIKKIDDFKNGKQKNKLYAYDRNTNQTISFEPKVENIKELNGFALTEKDKKKLSKGKKIGLPDGDEVYIDPTIKDNSIKIKSLQKRLLMATVLFDGGLTVLLLLSLKKYKERESKNKKKLSQENSAKYKESLNKMLSFLQKKKAQYPNEKGISNDINIVKKEKNSMGFNKSNQVKNTNKDIKNIQVNDYDDYEKYKEDKKERDGHEEEENETKKKNSGIKR
jgi:hypothetical protein